MSPEQHDVFQKWLVDARKGMPPGVMLIVLWDDGTDLHIGNEDEPIIYKDFHLNRHNLSAVSTLVNEHLETLYEGCDE